jgi:ribosomal protein L29
MRLSLLFVFVFGSLAVAQSAQQPSTAPTLADIARQKNANKAKKVITDEDIPERPKEAAVAADGAGDAAGNESQPKKKTSAVNLDEISAAQKKVDDLKDRESVLNKNLVKFQTSLETAEKEGNRSRVDTFTDSIEHAQGRLEELKKEREAAEQELASLKAAAEAAGKKKPAKKKASTASK